MENLGVRRPVVGSIAWLDGCVIHQWRPADDATCVDFNVRNISRDERNVLNRGPSPTIELRDSNFLNTSPSRKVTATIL